MIELKNVNKWYGDYHALVDINETIPTGEVVVVCGPSGSGKSTLIRTINRLEEIQSGTILLDGQDVHDPKLNVNQLRAGIGFVFQQFNLFPHLTVLENIIEAPMIVKGRSRDQIMPKAQELLRKVGLSEKADAYPARLSGGQKQRVAIARALAMEPDIMLFDEPTSALDPELTGEVLRTMRELAEEHMTMLVVTHEMGFAREVANTVAFMDQGELIEAKQARAFFEECSHPRIRSFLENML
jgi:polar amino acid transport system ATP-binding protein